MYASIDSIYVDIVLNLNKFQVEEGEKDIIVDGPQNFIYAFYDTVGKGHDSNRGNAVINIISGGIYKFSDTNQGKWLSNGILTCLAWGYLTPLDVGAALLQYFLAPGNTWFNIYKYCNSLRIFFTITYFPLEMHVIEKYGRTQFSFKHSRMGLAILILVGFQLLVAFNRPPPVSQARR